MLCFIVIVGYASRRMFYCNCRICFRVMFYCNCRIRFPGNVLLSLCFIVGYVSRVMFSCNCRIRFPGNVLLSL